MEHTEKPAEIERHYSLKEVAQITGQSKRTVQVRIEQGLLKAVQLPGDLRFSIAESDLRDYLSKAKPVEPKEEQGTDNKAA